MLQSSAFQAACGEGQDTFPSFYYRLIPIQCITRETKLKIKNDKHLIITLHKHKITVKLLCTILNPYSPFSHQSQVT